MWSTLKNIISFASSRGSFSVLMGKIYSRLFDANGSLSVDENLNWLIEQATSFEDYALNQNKKLWIEAKEFGKNLRARAKNEWKNIDVTLGEGGFYEMLYFLTRKYLPVTILETGVAAGFSSASFLAAIEQNKKGVLYSSDFPYFRIKDPEKYIGILVEQKHHQYWRLHINGDKRNFDIILPQLTQIDLFHYDSDKRNRAKWSAYKRISPYLNNGANVIFDDIQDDAFFHDLVEKRLINRSDWDVFSFEGKYIGWIRYSEK
jgi:predicted O-methyltransferase YrrM